MKYSILIITIFIIIAGFSSLDALRYFNPNSVALVDNAYGVNTNPAGLGLRLPSTMLFEMRYEGKRYINSGFFFKMLFAGFGYNEFRNENWILDRDYYLPIALPVSDSYSLGINNHWMQRNNDNTYSFGMGLMSRPFSWISFGLNIDHINKPIIDHAQLKPFYHTGIAIKPFERFFTIAVDSDFHHKVDFKQLRYHLIFSPFRGLEITTYFQNDNHDRIYYTGIYWKTAYSGLHYRSVRLHGTYQTHAAYEINTDYFPSTMQALNDGVGIINIGGALKDYTPQTYFGGGGTDPGNVTLILYQLDRCSIDRDIKAVIVKIKPTASPWLSGYIQEIAKKIEEVSEDKYVVAYIDEYASNNEYYLALHADDIVMAPQASIMNLGFANQALRIREAMNDLGIDMEMITAGDYKGNEMPWADPYNEKGRREVKELLSSMYTQFEQAVMKNRGGTGFDFDAALNAGIINADTALEMHMIDRTGYMTTVKDMIAHRIYRSVSKGKLQRMEKFAFVDLSRRYYYKESWRTSPKILVIPIQGMIHSGISTMDMIKGTFTTGAQTIRRWLNICQNNPQVVGVVLRIQSPGGTVTGSDLIYNEIAEFKKNSNKPIVASFGQYTFSGGYYVSCGVDEIIANPCTICGSIGVIHQKLNLAVIASNYNVKVETIKKGQYSDLGSILAPYTDAEREIIQHSVDHSYERFLKIVADGRGLTDEEVREVAQGRIYTGLQAQEAGLVDTMGGLEKAIDAVATRAGIHGEPIVLYFPPAEAYTMSQGGIMSILGMRSQMHSFSLLFPDLSNFYTLDAGPFLSWRPLPAAFK